MTNAKNSFMKGITRNIILLGLVSLFTDLSSQMVFPLIPLFMTTVLGAGAIAVGIVEGAAESTASLLKVVSGYWSDRIRKRKPFVLFGYSISTIMKPLFSLAYTWPIVLFVRIAERIGKGIRTAPRDAFVAESTDFKDRGKAYGFQRAMDGLGSMLGAVLAFLLLPVLGFRKTFLFAFIPGILAVLVILAIKEKKQMKDDDGKRQKKEQSLEPAKLSFKSLPSNLKMFIIVASIFTLGNFGYAFLLLKAQNIGLTDTTAILLYVLFYLVYTICIIPSGILSDRIGRKPVLATGYFVFAIVSVGLFFTTGLYTLLAFFVIYGIFFAMTDGVQRAFVVDLAPEHLKATALGTFHTAVGLFALPGGFIAGLLWDKIGPQATFAYGFALATLSLFMFVFVKTGAAKGQRN
jgi:MFS family permease